MAINYFGNISLENLAKKLAEHSEQYDLQKRALKEASYHGILTTRINIKSSLEKLNRANKIASAGRVFGFEFESEFCDCYTAYRFIERELIPLDSNSILREEGLFEFLNSLDKANIKRIFTGEISPKGYCGLRNREEEDEDGHWSRYNPINRSEDISWIEKRGIKIINLGILEE